MPTTPVHFSPGQIFSYFWGGYHYFSGLTEAAIAQAAASGATGITLAWNESVKSSDGTIVDNHTLTEITKVANIAHAHGLTVSLQPYFQISTGSDFLDFESFMQHFGTYSSISSNQPQLNAFLGNFLPHYKSYLTSLGQVAAQIDASYVAIGGEMSPLDASVFDDFWQAAINTIRGVFDGPLTYVMYGTIIYDQGYAEANYWDGAPYHHIDMYKWLDLVAPQIHEPLTSGTTATYAEAMAGLTASTVATTTPVNTLQAWKAYADGYGLPLITSESGFTSYLTPWNPANGSMPSPGSPTYNIQQAQLTQAFFDAVKLNPGVLSGITFISNVFPDDLSFDGLGSAQFSHSWWYTYGWSTWKKPAMYTYEASVSGTDTMHGIAGADFFVALVGRPTTIFANSGNDTMYCESTYGSKFFGQATSTNTAIYNGLSSDYTVHLTGTSLTVLDTKNSGAIPDTLSNVEILQFNDSTLDLRSTVGLDQTERSSFEGNGGTTAITFTVSLSTAGATSLSVGWSLAGAGARPADAADFGGTLPSGTVTFAPGETSKTIMVAVRGDTAPELDEGFTVTLDASSPWLILGTDSASGTILNDDASVSISAASATQPEGNIGTTTFTFTATLIGDISVAHSVAYAVTGSGSYPVNAADFQGGVLPTGMLTFAAGETSKTIAIQVAGDASVESDEGFIVSLSSPSLGLTIGMVSAGATILNDDKAVIQHNDAYIVLRGQSLSIGPPSGLLYNDLNASTAILAGGPTHGTLQLSANGGFTYAPTPGFTGVDEFSYHSSNSGSSEAGHGLIYVVPISTGASATLDLLALTAEEQIAATYAAFFGRAADAGGFEFWLGQFNTGLPVQGPAALFANIASSFGISAEAKALYPFLVSPFGASEGQISTFLDSVYHNLFNRSSDAGGLAYWTNQIQQTLAAGQFVGSVLVNIISGAQETVSGKDITTLMGKVSVSLAYVREQEEHEKKWWDADTAAATALMQAVTADPLTVLTGVKNAELLITNHG